MLNIDSNFPGGNIIVERIDGDHVWLRQDLRDTEGWWFYWLCRVAGAAGRSVTFHFTNGNVLTDRGAAISVDGLHWRLLAGSSRGRLVHVPLPHERPPVPDDVLDPLPRDRPRAHCGPPRQRRDE